MNLPHHQCRGAKKSAVFVPKENIWEGFRSRCFCVLDENKLIVHSGGNGCPLKRQLKRLFKRGLLEQIPAVAQRDGLCRALLGVNAGSF